MKNIFLLILALYLPLAMAWTASSIKGEVWIESGESKVTVTADANVPDDSLVATGPGARLELRDGTNVLRLGSNTKLRIKSISQNSDTLKLLYGKLRAQVKPAAGQSFRVETRVAVSGVRGTEYFLQSDESHDFICTLEGLVEVESKLSGQMVLVPPRAGVEIAEGKPFSVQPTADELVDTWIGETGTGASRVVVNDGYHELPLRYHSLGSGLLFGARAHALLGRADHVGYNSVGTSDHNWFSQYRLTPALRWGQSLAIAWEPRLLWHASDQPFLLDQDPTVVGKSYVRASLGEFYGEAALGSVQLRVGQQAIQWNDGVLFTADSWRLDPFLYRGLRASGSWRGHYLEALAIRRGDAGELNGAVRADILALKYDYKTWLSVIASERNFTPVHGSRIAEILVQSARRLDMGDYRLTLWHQGGGYNMWEAGLGVYPWNGRRFRTGLGIIHSDPNFTPGASSGYDLGYSLIFERSNLRQYRGKLSYATEGWDLFIEWIHSQSVGSGSGVKWSGRYRDLMSEQDIGASTGIGKNIKLMLAGFRAQPTVALSSSSPDWPRRVGYGLAASVQYTY